MRNIQEKTLEQLEGELGLMFQTYFDSLGLEVVKHAEWANQGVLHIQPGSSLRTFGAIHYSFQSGYCTMTFIPPGGRNVLGGEKRENYAYCQYNNGDELSAGVTKMVEQAFEAIQEVTGIGVRSEF